MQNRQRSLSLLSLTLAVLGSFLIPVNGLHTSPVEEDKWSPVGPFINEVLIKVYPNPSAEYCALQNGSIDLTDWPVTPSGVCISQVFVPTVASRPTPEFVLFDLEFNLANRHFGVPFDLGNNPAGIHIRMAVAHLIDKRAHASQVLGGRGVGIDNPASPSQGVPEPDFRQFDSLHGAVSISAFNLADDPNPAPAVGSQDWSAAREHLLAAGFTASGSLLASPTGTVDFYVRSDDPRRTALGNNLASAWNSLFVGGAGGVVVHPASITDVFPIVFGATPRLDWHFYTGGFRLDPTWDHLFRLYHSGGASNECGGTGSKEPANYIFVCIPALDDKLAGLHFGPDTSTSLAFATEAMLVFGQHAVTIPVWTPLLQFGYLPGWAGIINAQGVGPPNINTLLNAVCGSSVGTICPSGPDSAAGRLRWGFSSGTFSLNIFKAITVNEFYVLSEVYDSLLASNPMDPIQLTSNMANKWQIFLDGQGLGYAPPAGTRMSIRFQLRPNIFFHDGVTRLTARDVKFSILSYRDVRAVGLQSRVTRVIDVTALNDALLDVHLNEQSPFAERRIGLLPILNSRLWDLNNDGRVDSGLDRADVVANGILAKDGSGPYRFTSVTGGDESIFAGDIVLLSRFGPANQSAVSNQYFRASGIYKNFAWADVNDGAGLKVDVTDVAAVALCFGKPATESCAYWDTVAGGNGEGGHTPLVGAVPNVVDIVEFSAVANYFGQQWLFPAGWNSTLYEGIETFPFVPPGP